MSSDLFGEGADAATSPSLPDWFRGGKTVPRAHVRNVLLGLHPFGGPLTDVPGALCGNCARLELRGGASKDYWKCSMNRRTKGLGTDVRVGWRGCSSWSVAPPGEKIPRVRPAP